MESAAADYLKATLSLTFSLNSKTESVSLYVWTRMDEELDFFVVQTGPLFYFLRLAFCPPSCFPFCCQLSFFKAFVTIQDAQLKIIDYAT